MALRSKKRGLPRPIGDQINCRRCGTLNTPGCQECKSCSRDCGCRCQMCTPCSRKAGHQVKHSPKAKCRECGACRRGRYTESTGKSPVLEFCQCRSMPKWMKVVDPKATERVVNTLARPLGLEIELCNIGKTGGMGTGWDNKPEFLGLQFEHDGSVRGAATEAVLNPLVGDQFLQGLGWLSKYFIDVGAQVDDSCGLHVHVGAQDLGPYELRRVVALYQKCQQDIYGKMIPPSRQKPSPVNGKYYCAPYTMDHRWWNGLWACKTPSALREYIFMWTFKGTIRSSDTGFDRDKFRKMSPQAKGKAVAEWKAMNRQGAKVTKYVYPELPERRRQKYQIPSRYYGLNIHSWFQRGTIEFRHYPGTLNPDELISWPLMCGWLVQLGSALRDEEVKAISGGLEEVVTTKWSHGFSQVQVPQGVAEWVVGELHKERNW